MYRVRDGYREYSLPWLLFALIGGIAIWELVFAFSYFGARPLCIAGAGWVLHLAAGVGIVIVAASMVAAVRLIQVTSAIPEVESSARDERTRFLSTQGLVLGIFGLFGILGVEVANVFIFCQ